MSVMKEPNGRRSVQVEAVVPGTPEQVWQAIATGPGVSSWFVPTEVETDASGKPVRVVSHMGPGMDAVATPRVWDPPRRFAADSQDLGPGAPNFATEWIVEARDGGTCTVRVIHSLFSETDDWDNQLEGTESGWPGFFVVLRLYLEHFAGQPCRSVLLVIQCAGEPSEVWAKLKAELGLEHAKVGESVKSPSLAPRLSGILESVTPHRVVVRTLPGNDVDAPKVVSLAVHPCGPMNLMIFSAYVYGKRAEEVAGRVQSEWQAWLNHQAGHS